MKRVIYILIFSFLPFSCKDHKEAKIENLTKDKGFSQLTSLVDFFAEDILSKGNSNAIAVAIYKDGKMYQNYYGTLDKEGTKKPNNNALFEIASITKTFTGALVAKAVLDGKIGLENDIRTYLDGDYPNLEFSDQPITVKHLLTHSMGLKNRHTKGFGAIRNKVTSGTYSSKTDFYTVEDLLEELKTVEVDKQPGTVFAYNSLGPELLAYILEKVYHKPFKEQMNQFFKELEMNDTYLNESQKYKDRLVIGYNGDVESSVDYAPVYGAAGGAISTLPDLANYMKYLVDNKNTPWIKEASRPLFTDPEDGEQIGYLWQGIDTAEEEGFYYSKTGTSNGVQSSVLICPDSNYAIAVMVNGTSDESLRDWELLLFRDIEPMVIKYPKMKLTPVFRKTFNENPSKAYENFRKHKSDTINYSFSLAHLNNFGYDLLNEEEHQKAIMVFQFLTQEFPEKANIFDSLGEAYFITEDYDNALINYKKAIQINPDMKTSKNYIKKIEDLISK